MNRTILMVMSMFLATAANAMEGYYRLAGPCTGARWDVNSPNHRTPVPQPLVPGGAMSRVALDRNLPEFRLDRGELRFVASDGAPAATALASAPGRKVRSSASGLSFDDRRRQGSGLYSWLEYSRWNIRSTGEGRIEAEWRVSESADQLSQTCVYERVVPAPAPSIPDASVPFRCHAELREPVPFELVVSVGEQAVFREVFNPAASSWAPAGQAGRWFNDRWEQNGQGPVYGEIELTARGGTLWSEDFELGAEGPSATVASANALTPGASFALAIDRSRLLLTTSAGATERAEVHVDGSGTTAAATATVALGKFSRIAQVEGHALESGEIFLTATLQLGCRKPGVRP